MSLEVRPSSALLASALLLLTATGASAGVERFEVGVQGGFYQPDDRLSGKAQTLEELEPELGIRLGLRLGERWNWFIDGTVSDFNTNSGAGDLDILALRTGIEWWVGEHWLLALGGGQASYDFENFGNFDRWFGSFSVGQHFALDERATLRWELREDYTLDDEGVGGRDFGTPHLLIGVAWKFGEVAGDDDGDGVNNRRDECPDTPRGARVDEQGCPLDGDGDGVFDGIDQCPDTPRDYPVDARGCSLDTDGDGVPDGADDCPDTPRGARVDERGCPLDTDGDGVFDGIDQCPDTPRGAVVDDVGCPIDSDGDGVFDGFDQCPGTPPGTTVNAVGCPRVEPLFVEERMTLILEGVFFELNSDVLAASSREALDRVALSLIDWREIRVEIGGHTDSTGTDEYNLDLSRKRAESVRAYLVGQGVDSSRMTTAGYGEAHPLIDNATAAGRARNRRVELNRNR